MDDLQKAKKKYKTKKTGDSWYIYQNELDKVSFQHEMAYGNFKDLTKRTAFNKIFHSKAFSIAKNPRYDGYEKGLTSLVYKFFDERTAGGAAKNEIG